jgi:hypothetical protein
MLMGDLLTLVQHRLPAKVVVFNNGALGFIELEQKSTGFLDFGTELKNPNFAAMAEAAGIRGIRIEDPAKVEDGIATGACGATLGHRRDGEGLLALHGEGDHERSGRRGHRSRKNQSMAVRRFAHGHHGTSPLAAAVRVPRIVSHHLPVFHDRAGSLAHRAGIPSARYRAPDLPPLVRVLALMPPRYRED